MVTRNAIGTATGAAATVLTGNGVGVTPTFQAIPAGGDVTAAANLTDDYVVTGDGGAKGVQTSSMKIDASGQMTNTSQPAFLAYLGTSDISVTGDGTAFTFGSGNALTEVFDQNADFATNGIFTAPVTGKYLFNWNIYLQSVAADTQSVLIYLVTTSTTYLCCNTRNASSNDFIVQGSMFVDLSATNTAYLRITVTGGNKTVSVNGSNRNNRFSGFLVC